MKFDILPRTNCCPSHIKHTSFYLMAEVKQHWNLIVRGLWQCLLLVTDMRISLNIPIGLRMASNLSSNFPAGKEK